MIDDSPTPSAPSSADPEEGPTSSAPGRHVLLVDDDSLGRKLVMVRLQLAGFRVTPTSTGEEALSVAKTLTFDAVVSDIRMPGMSGFDLRQAMRDEAGLADLPFVLLSSVLSGDDERRAAELGAACLVRSAELLDLIETLTAALPQRREESASDE